MKRILLWSLFTFLAAAIPAAEPWQRTSDPTVAEAARLFQSPPPEYGAVLWWGWDGDVNEAVIQRDLDNIKAHGFTQVMIEAGYNMPDGYLTDGWFARVALAVREAKARGMRVWVEDEGKYPSGFAGGRFSKLRPELREQALWPGERIPAVGGVTIDREVSLPDTICVVAVNQADHSRRMIPIENGRFRWTAPQGGWEIQVVEHQFRTGQTRSVNNLQRAKTTDDALMDYLNPAATAQLIAWTHEGYLKAAGSEFGKTLMGLRGDEPALQYTPWTPGMVEAFRLRKGYDIRPYLGALAQRQPALTEEERRAKADYWDVWSDLYHDNYSAVLDKWCSGHNLEYSVHIEHEEDAPNLVRIDGDFFKFMRHVGVPGVDAIWSQIWMDHEADFPKLASSAAHLFGRPRSFTESFAAYRPTPNVEQAKWILDYQMVRGINLVEVMFMGASSQRPPVEGAPAATTRRPGGTRFFMQPEFLPVVKAVHRTGCLLAQGQPAAKIGLYYPTTSMWLGDNGTNESVLAIAQKLLEAQRDFDFVDEQALASVMKLSAGKFINLSGQAYEAIVLPSISVISRAALDRLEAYAATGGKVIFLGRLPGLVNGKSFLNAEKAPGLSWALREASGDLTPAVLAALPRPDVALSIVSPKVRALHRELKDADVYFFFNEGEEPVRCEATLEGSDQAQLWDGVTGAIDKLAGTAGNGTVRVPLELGRWAARLIVISPAPTARASTSETPLRKFDFGSGKVAEGWTQVLPGMEITSERGYGFEPQQKVEAIDRGGDPLKGDFITSDKPFLFSVVLPEGNYWVKVTLGDDQEASDSTIKAELRRLMVEGLKTAPGEHAERTFMVNIRTPRIPGDGEVRLKPREQVGQSEAVAWDNKLTIEFNSSRPCVDAIEIGRAPDDMPVVYLMGDSTVCDQPTPPWNSWGQMLTRWLKPDVIVANNAESGESYASSISEQRLAKVMSTIKKGDYMFMQFGHNDMKAGTVEERHYKDSIRRYIDSARSKGAIPVLVTPVNRRTFDADGKITNSLGGYPQAARDVAREEGTALIDLNAMSKTLYETLGPKRAELLFAESKPGVHDGTHHSDYGSYEISKCIVDGIIDNGLDLAKHIVDDFIRFDPAKPDQPDQVKIAVSPGFSSIRPLGK